MLEKNDRKQRKHVNQPRIAFDGAATAALFEA